MIETAASPAVDASTVETLLREELAQGDAMLGSVGPILRHLLTNDDNSIFSEEVIARVRGMLTDLARQLFDQLAAVQGDDADRDHDGEKVAAVARLLSAQPPLLAHVHAVALEAQLTDRLHARLSLDPVLSPLLQALVASPQASVAGEAMGLLAAQARFVQAMRRMQLPLTELPGDLFHVALLTLRHFADETVAAQAAEAEAQLRARYDESRTRLGQIARIVTGMGGGAAAALAIGHGGVAIFLTALALASGQDRDLATLATGEGQMVRLMLSLRGAGLKPSAVEEQFLALHPDALLPAGFEMVGADRAAAILALSNAWPGG